MVPVAARLLRFWVRIPKGAWMCVMCCECCELSDRCLSDELITRPEQPSRLWCVVVCDLETSIMRRPWPALGHRATGKKPLLLIRWPIAPLLTSSFLISLDFTVPYSWSPLSTFFTQNYRQRSTSKRISGWTIKLYIHFNFSFFRMSEERQHIMKRIRVKIPSI